MADTADAPTVKDLPKLDDHIKDEIVKDVQLKHIEVQLFTLWLFLVQDMWVSVTICFGNRRNSKSLGSYKLNLLERLFLAPIVVFNPSGFSFKT